MICVSRNKQQGAALVVGLILLIVVTLVAISGIKSTSVQQSLAVGMQENMMTYQVADTLIRQVVNEVNDTAPLADANGDGVPDNPHILVSAIMNNDVTIGQDVREIPLEGGEDGLTADGELGYHGTTPNVPGYSIGKYVGHLFQLDSTAELRIDNLASSQAINSLGLMRVAPYAGP